MLTPKTIDGLKPRDATYGVADGDVDGLQLLVHSDGTRVWSLRYRNRQQQQRRLKLGEYPRLGLSDARKLANKHLRGVDEGVDPQAKKAEDRDAKLLGTFLDEQYLPWAQEQKRSWREDARRIKKYLRPWKSRPVVSITRAEIRDLLASIKRPVEANRTHALLSKILSRAIVEDVLQAHPMTKLGDLHPEHARERVLSHAELRVFWESTENMTPEMGAFFRLRLLTLQRGGEVQSMKWSDIDSDGVWTISATVAKNKILHRVPLAAPVVDILKTLHQRQQDTLQQRKARQPHREPTPEIYVLAGARGARQQREAINTIPIADFRGHDLRRTATSLMAAHGVSEEMLDRILNHVDDSVTAKHYNRYLYDKEKRAVLDQWARVLTGILEETESNVLAFVR